MGDAEQALALKLYVVLTRANSAVHRHAELDIARRGLTPGEFAILEALYHKGPLALGELQRKILVSSAGVTYLVDRLEAEGLAERRHAPEDRRIRHAALTEAGEELMREIFPAHAAAITRAFASLDETEKQQAIALLKKLGTSAAASAAAGDVRPARR